MAIPIHRIMTFKSKLGSGKYGDYTIQELINLGRQAHILKAYFTITNVDFSIDVLCALKMDTWHQIPKPGSKWEKYNPTLKELYPSQHRRIYDHQISDQEKAMTTSARSVTKGALQRKNQKR